MIGSLTRQKTPNLLRMLLAVLAVAAAAAVLAACGSSGTSSAGGSGSTSTGSPVATTGGSSLKTATIGGATVLTSSKGFTLYSFAPDTATKSNCNGTCAQNWPPLKGTATASGVTGTFGTIKRSDGSVQATFDGHPLYTFAGDTAAGQANGNGLNVHGRGWQQIPPSGTDPPGSSGGGDCHRPRKQAHAEDRPMTQRHGMTRPGTARGAGRENAGRAAPGWPAAALRVAGAGLLIAAAAIHLDLYLTGYRTIPVIGWLFLLQVIAAFGLGLGVLAGPGRFTLAGRLAAAAGAGFALATLGGYLLSVAIGLFGFTEVRTTAGTVAGVVEVGAFVGV